MTFPARPVKKAGRVVAVLETNNSAIDWPEGKRYIHGHYEFSVYKLRWGSDHINMTSWLPELVNGCGKKRNYHFCWISKDMARIRAT